MSGENVLSLSTYSQDGWATKHAGPKQIKYPGSVPLQAWHCSDNGIFVPSKCPAHWPDHDPTYNHEHDIHQKLQNHCTHFPLLLKEEYRQMSQRSNSRVRQQKQRAKLTLIYPQRTSIILTWHFLISKWQNKTNSRENDWGLDDHRR